MARVDLRASRKTTPTIFKKHHHPHQKNMRNAVKKRNQASIFDSLALSSFHTFSLSLRRRKFPPKPHVLEHERLARRKQDRRWLDEMIKGRTDAMYPSERERQAFNALTKLPTDQALFEALTEGKVYKKVKMLYARLLRERDMARKDQGKYHTDAVADWWTVQKVEKKAKKGKKGKGGAEHEESEAYTKVDWGTLCMSMAGEEKKEEKIFEMAVPFRGPRV